MKKLLQMKNLERHYETPAGVVRALDGVSFEISEGERVILLGPSGSGKTTLLNCLSALDSPSGGEYTFLDSEVPRNNSEKMTSFRRENIGYVFQQFNLIPYLDAIDNIRLASQFSQGKKHPQLIDEIKALLTSLSIPATDWQSPTRNLSIGQQQRVAIARALINKPQILIADEPTSSLDQANRDAFMTLLMSIVSDNNMTLLFVSHDMSLAGYFSRVEALSDINISTGENACLPS